MSDRIDTLVRVETPEGITLPLRTAGIHARGMAFLVDVMVRFGLLSVASVALSFLEGVGAGLWLVLLFLVEWFYPVFFEMGTRGATPGKRALGLRVVMDDGMPPTLAASVLRNLLRVVDFLPFGYAIGALSMLMRRDFKRLGDIVAGTLVIHERPAGARSVPPAAEPQGPARALTPAQQTAIVDWALRTPRITAARAEELAVLARPVLRPGPGTPAERLMSLAHWAMGKR